VLTGNPSVYIIAVCSQEATKNQAGLRQREGKEKTGKLKFHQKKDPFGNGGQRKDDMNLDLHLSPRGWGSSGRWESLVGKSAKLN